MRHRGEANINEMHKDIAERRVRFAMAVLRGQKRDPDCWEALHLTEAITACTHRCWMLAAVLAETALLEPDARASGGQQEPGVVSLSDLEHAFDSVFSTPNEP